MKELHELLHEEAANKLKESFVKANIFPEKTRAEALAAYRRDHVIVVDDNGELKTSYNGVFQSLSTALSSYGRTSDGEQFTDRRSLPKDEQNQGGIRSKSDFKSIKERTDFISKFGAAAFENLPSRWMPESEVRTRQDFYKLTVSQKSALIKANPNILHELPSQVEPDVHGMSNVAGARVNVAGLERDRATRPNQK